MRPGFKEVNVRGDSTVPRRGWLARVYLWTCERLYDELAWQYDVVSWLVSAGQWHRWQTGVWREVRGRDILEVGCGTGRLLQAGLAQGLKMAGVDRSPRMLAVAHRRLQQAGSACALIQGDGCALPIQDGAVDSVVATFPAAYILTPQALAEVRRVLREGGRVVILGLWVALHLRGVERMVPLFYGRPSAAALEAIKQRTEAAGFRVEWLEEQRGIVSVGLLVGERV
jgi:SAM-dependent methyltransferase